MFQIETIEEDGGVRVRLAGECDLHVSQTIKSALADARRRAGPEGSVVIDLGDVEFIDSMAVDLLVLAYREAKAGRWSLCIEPAPPHVQRVFEVLKLDAVLPFVARER